ncbi:hypothetical protein F5877DRAFT_80392 [Lentinula edodes]|nr:hypothetical protein F5877DRAFT_80392 [Lentinula edodes]
MSGTPSTLTHSYSPLYLPSLPLSTFFYNQLNQQALLQSRPTKYHNQRCSRLEMRNPATFHLGLVSAQLLFHLRYPSLTGFQIGREDPSAKHRVFRALLMRRLLSIALSKLDSPPQGIPPVSFASCAAIPAITSPLRPPISNQPCLLKLRLHLPFLATHSHLHQNFAPAVQERIDNASFPSVATALNHKPPCSSLPSTTASSFDSLHAAWFESDSESLPRASVTSFRWFERVLAKCISTSGSHACLKFWKPSGESSKLQR